MIDFVAAIVIIFIGNNFISVFKDSLRPGDVTLLQYMACGIAAIASPVGMNLEVVHPGKNRYLVNSYVMRADTLKGYKDGPDMRKLHGDYGFSVVLENFTVKSQLDNVIHVLND